MIICVPCLGIIQQEKPVEIQPLLVTNVYPIICERCKVNAVILSDGTVVGGVETNGTV